jgi:hypothetical protein
MRVFQQAVNRWISEIGEGHPGLRLFQADGHSRRRARLGLYLRPHDANSLAPCPVWFPMLLSPRVRTAFYPGMSHWPSTNPTPYAVVSQLGTTLFDLGRVVPLGASFEGRAAPIASPELDNHFKLRDVRSFLCHVHAMRAFDVFLLVGLTVVIACSSSSATGGGGGTTNGCSCDLSYNGASRTIACGSDTCLNGVSFACGKSAGVTKGGACTDTGDPDGGGATSTDTGGTSSCKAFGAVCKSTLDKCCNATSGARALCDAFGSGTCRILNGAACGSDSDCFAGDACRVPFTGGSASLQCCTTSSEICTSDSQCCTGSCVLSGPLKKCR